MVTTTALIGVGAGVLSAVVGVGLLRRAWRRPQPAAPTVAGWALIVVAAAGWALVADLDKAIALSLVFPSLAGLSFVLANAEVRASRRQRTERAATQLPDRSSEAVWRGVARAVCAGPLAGGAAVLLAAAWALKGAGSEADRTGVALILAPMFWAGGMVWATTDRKLARLAAGLGAMALAGGLAAVL